MSNERPMLSLCTTCRDGREDKHNDVRGGTRMAKAFLETFKNFDGLQFDLRGVACMSQCKRSCVVAVCAGKRFSYMFGDLDPKRKDYIESFVEFLHLYVSVPEGFLSRNDRPLLLQKNILTRIPPPRSVSRIVSTAAFETRSTL